MLAEIELKPSFIVFTSAPLDASRPVETSGMHVYLTMTRPPSLEDRKTMADGLVAALKHRGLVFDTGVTTDAVRVLRPCGSLNRKIDEVRSRASIWKASTVLIMTPMSCRPSLAPSAACTARTTTPPPDDAHVDLAEVASAAEYLLAHGYYGRGRPPRSIRADSALCAAWFVRAMARQCRDICAGQHTLGVFRMSTALASSLLKLAALRGRRLSISGNLVGLASRLLIFLPPPCGVAVRARAVSHERGRRPPTVLRTRLAAGNDIAIFLDDTSHVIDARTIVQVVYMVSGGQGKTRMRADKSPTRALNFASIVNSNGEVVIPTTLKEARIL